MADKTKEQQNEQQKVDELKKQGKPESPAESEKQEKSEKPDEQEPLLLDEPIKVKDYIYLNMLTLEGKAWAYMDLIAHPETQKHTKDMAQAKLAIDTIDALFKIIEGHLNDDQRKDLQTRLTNLRLNFVK
jgi:hemolysin activation/secretion protein